MQGTILQILFLVAHGNLALSDQATGDIYPNDTAFKFNESVRFVDIERYGNDLKETVFAQDPNAWLFQLKSQKCSGLRVERLSTDNEDISDRSSVAFAGGGGRWLIEAVFPDGSDYWEANWEVGNREHVQRKIWQVRYVRIARNQKKVRPAQTASIGELSQYLATTLNKALEFSKKHELMGFANSFEVALSALESQIEPELHDLAIKGQLSAQAARLIVAAQLAWVFGGMGSWNDIGFDGEEEQTYQTISADLFRQINEALVISINTSFPKQSSG